MQRVPLGPVKTPGLDTSHWDGPIDFKKVRASGRVFCIQKCNEYTIDATYKRNMIAARAAGMIWGAYDFFHPGKDAANQAKMFIANSGLKKGDLPPMLDWETTDGMDREHDKARAKIWLELVEEAFGVVPMIYCGPYFADALRLDISFAKYPLVVAHYGVTAPLIPAPWKTCTFHQFTDKGDVPGIPAPDEDLDWFNGSEAQLRAMLIK